ncbi:MAG TPA: trypsin-like peptidase domain-containing protein [Pyrinomonadaceae bacterium]|nr:trypsin-like peptidase domain-containing protein [Pyrinomonadaceae bacterium]
MANGLVIHVVAGLGKHTEVLTSDRIRIGSHPSCELRLPASEVPTDNAILELARANGHYRVKSYDSTLGITHNGEPIVSNSRVNDGDEIRVGAFNVMLTFFSVGGLAPVLPGARPDTHVAPFIEQAALESSSTARRDDAKIFLREFTRELVREISITTKLIALGIALALVGGMLYIGFAMYRELVTSRRIIDEQNRQLKEMRENVAQTSGQISQLNEKNNEFVKSLSFAPTTWTKYHRGVALISGIYYFVEKGTGRPLRYPEQTGEAAEGSQSEQDPTQLTPEGKGPIYEREFVGTGFYVGGEFILTNRHVVQPWLADEGILKLNTSVPAQPRVRKIMAFFPEATQPVPLKFKMAAQQEDLAVCTFDKKDLPEGIPLLPLDRGSDDSVGVGKAVVLMGYPNGPDRILALLTDAERMSVTARYGDSIESLLNYLSQSKRIQPLTTQGHITDLDSNSRLIVYDATTATGGSGSPLFGSSGRVIGVNFEVFTENTASNHAVPIRYAITLLQRAGWQAPEAAEGNQNENANATQTGAPRTTGVTSANSAR